MKFPCFYLIRQNLPERGLPDVPAEARRQLEQADFASRVKPGAKIAIGAGSRGIANIAIILRAVVDYWKDHGSRPFIFPAMGSHGASTAEGQAEVLARFGIDETTMDCPLVSSLEVVPMGRTTEGIETFMDRNAYESDGVMLVGRVKWHTRFEGRIESGLCKMTAIGMGKLAGAQHCHAFGQRIGLEQVIRSVYRRLTDSGKILGGLAILEDANHATARLAALHQDELVEQEERLLELVKSWRARIPVESLDLLIVDEIGKHISGTGMDTKVVNRSIHAEYNPYPSAPIIHRIFVRNLSALSHGNAVGLGMADIVSDRVLGKINWDATYANSLTACSPAGIRIPIHFPADRECLEKIAPTAGKLEPQELAIGWIANTMKLRLFAFTENLLPEIRANPLLEVVSPRLELKFDSEGNLTDLEELTAQRS